jgi:hypothetical protein
VATKKHAEKIAKMIGEIGVYMKLGVLLCCSGTDLAKDK